MTTRSISISNRHPRLRLDRRAIIRAIEILDASHADIRVPRSAFLAGELSLVFMTDAALAQLHADFLDDPAPTDVITFEGDPAFGTAGEICVSADAAFRHVSPLAIPASPRTKIKRTTRETTVQTDAAFSDELMLYLVHGWLHLAGYDDLQPAKKRIMRRAEARALQLLHRHHKGLPRFSLAKRS